MNERRLDGRFLCADLVRVSWKSGYGPDGRPNGKEEFRTVEAVLEDISAPGACIQVEEMMAPGTPVSLEAEGQRFFGVVSYCVYRDYGYFAGIRFADETRWSEGAFAPQHLTDLRALAGEGPAT